MPTYTAPTTRSSGFLVTAAVYNTDLVENIKYFKDAPTFDGAVTASSTLTAANNVGLAATKKLYLDGVALTGDTYLTESSANVLSLFSGGVEAKLTSGVLTVSGLGAHTFSASGGQNTLAVRATTAGTGNYARVLVGNDASESALSLAAFSSTYTTSGPAVANGISLYGEGAGGISIWANHASGTIRFYSGGTTVVHETYSTGLALSLTKKLWFDGGSDTYIHESSANNLQIVAGSQGYIFNTTGFAPGIYPTTASVANLYTSGNGDYIYRVTSLRVVKHDIQTIDANTANHVLGGLNPVWYRSRIDKDQRQWPGFVAEEVAAVDPRLAMFDADGVTLQSVAYDRVASYLVVGWQQHDAIIQSLAVRIAALEAGA